MGINQLTVRIARSPAEVFAFVTDPRNTPLWIDSIVVEEADYWPVRLGTVYRNLNRQGEWREYTMTAYEQNKLFVLGQNSGSYHVRYVLCPIGKTVTELEYTEWEDGGVVDAPFTPDILEKLKQVLEGGEV